RQEQPQRVLVLPRGDRWTRGIDRRTDTKLQAASVAEGVPAVGDFDANQKRVRLLVVLPLDGDLRVGQPELDLSILRKRDPFELGALHARRRPSSSP